MYEDALRFISGRLGTEAWAEGAVGLVSGRVDTEELVGAGRRVWFALGAGDCCRETSELFSISFGGAESADVSGSSTKSCFGSCWEFELPPSLAGVSVILASSISPSSTSSFPEAVLTIFGKPFTLEIFNQKFVMRPFSRHETYAGREFGWKSGAFGFSVLVASLSGRGVDGFADVDLTPLVAAPLSVFVMLTLSTCI